MRILAALVFAMLWTGSAWAEEALPDRVGWLQEAVGAITAGDLDALQGQLDETLGAQRKDDVRATILPLRRLADDAPVYVEPLEGITHATAFETHHFIAYYGERAFVIYRFVFARLEDGWHLWRFDYSDDLGRIVEPWG